MTVFTPDALERSVARGAFKTARLGDFLSVTTKAGDIPTTPETTIYYR